MTGHCLSPGTILGGRYVIERSLSRGQSVSVYLAQDRSRAGESVVVRMLPQQSPISAEVASLREEFSLLCRLKHPNLARILDFAVCEESGSPYWIEEYVEGVDLFRGTADCTTGEIIAYLVELCKVMRYLHVRGIIHRALRPSKVMLAAGGGCEEKLRILDLGFSGLSRTVERPDDPVSLAYTAPESLLGHEATHKTDLYSLGILAYQLLARRLPFEDEDPGFLIQKHLHARPDLQPIERLQGGAQLARTLRQLLEKDPEKRPGSAEDVIHALEEVNGTGPSSGRGVPEENYFSASKYVGRENEMTFLRQRAQNVRQSGRGTTIFLCGESGIGKTRFMEELKIWGLLEGWRVVEAGCQPGEDRSYGPYRQILSRTGGVLPEQAEDADFNQIFSFEDMRRAGEKTPFDVPTESAAGQFRDRLTREIVRRLSDRPTLLLLSDFHGADEAGTAVLDYLSSDIQAFPILMCVSLRPGEAEIGTIGQLKDRAVRQLRAEVLALEPLGADATMDMIAGITGAADLGRLIGPRVHSYSGGNPFFVEEILKHLVDQGLLQRDGRSWKLHEAAFEKLQPPSSVTVVLERRLDQLSGPAREKANWLAVFNRAVPIGLLESIVGQRRPDSRQALQELEMRQIIRVEAGTGEERFELRHALISEVIQAKLPQKELRRMHRIIGEMLERHCDSNQHLRELATHFTEADCGEKAVHYALKAAAACRAEFANQAALKFYDYILGARSGLSRAVLAEAAIEAADACCALGLPRRAIRMLEKRLHQPRFLDLELKSRLMIQLAYSYQYAGDLKMLAFTARKGLKICRRSDSPQSGNARASFLMQLAYCELLHSHPRLSLAHLADALTSITSPTDLFAGRIFAAAAAINRVSCNIREGTKAATKSIAILEAHQDFSVLPSAYSNLGICLTALGRLPLALETHDRAVKASENLRSVVVRSQALGNLAECLCRSGRQSDALLVAERAIKLVGDSGNPAIAYAFNTTYAEIMLSSGKYDGAFAVLRQLGGSTGPDLAMFSRAHACYLNALFHFRVGKPDRALVFLDQMSRIESRDAPIYEHELGAVLRAMIMAGKGQVPRAIRLLESIDRAVAGKHWPYQMCVVKLHLAEVFLSAGRTEPAGALARNALRLARGMRCLPLLAHAQLITGLVGLGTVEKRRAAGGGEESPVAAQEIVAGSRRALLEAVRWAEESQALEIAWQAHVKLADLSESAGNGEDCRGHAEKAHNCLTFLESHVPAEFKESYRASLGRDSALQSCRRRLAEHRRSSPAFALGDMPEEHVRMLLRVSTLINGIRDPDRLMDSIAALLIQAVGAERAMVFLKSDKHDRLRFARGLKSNGESLGRTEAVDPDILEAAFVHGRPFVSADGGRDPRLPSRDSALRTRPGTLFCAPLKTGGQTLGVLYADHPSSQAGIREATINLFAAFCNLAAVAIDNALTHRRLVDEKSELEGYLKGSPVPFPEIVGKSAAVSKLRERMVLVAGSPLDVLICGESGTGKELVAQALHRTGRRAAGPFVPVDCGSLSDTLAEGELFGYRKGAFTGAAENRGGLLEAAQGGILFLDELANLSSSLQTKLLRVLQEREVRRIGETTPRKLDVQIIAATNKNLHGGMRSGKFREDLYYRLGQMEIRVPALRERMADVPILLEWFMLRTADAAGGRPKNYSKEALDLLLGHPYPGNVRELQGAVQSSYYLSPGMIIGVEHLPEHMRGRGGESFGHGEGSGERIYRQIRSGKGSFENLVKNPFGERKFGTGVVREVLHHALKEGGGRYRDAFRLLKIAEASYSAMMLFLKRNKCYLDYRDYRDGSR